MSEIKIKVNEQLQQLQRMMQRASFGQFMGKARMHDPNRGQGRALAILKLKPEISQRELTYLLNMSKQAAAEIISKLEKNGYITREASAEDKRVMIIKLTEEGANVSAETESSTEEKASALDCLSEEELTAFSGYLERVIKSYEEQFPDVDFDGPRRMMEEFMSHHGHGFGRHGHRSGRGHGFGKDKGNCEGCGHHTKA
jgi:Transcriptional regulators